MKKDAERRGKGKEAAVRILTGTGVAVLTVMVFLAVTASAVGAGKVREDAIGQLVTATACVGAFFGSIAVIGKGKEKQPGYGLICAACLVVLKLVVSAFMSEGSLFDPADLKIFCALIFSGIAATVLCAGKRKRKKHS